jgi:hypothetical protein
MRTLIGIFALAGTLGLLAGCGKKQCEPIPESAAVKSMGIVLPGGSLCSDKDSIVHVEYPKEQAEKMAELHTDALGKAGWTVDSPSKGVILANRGADTLFIVTTKETQESPFPMAIVRYCQTEPCRKKLTGIAEAMKKQEAELNKP